MEKGKPDKRDIFIYGLCVKFVRLEAAMLACGVMGMRAARIAVSHDFAKCVPIPVSGGGVAFVRSFAP